MLQRAAERLVGLFEVFVHGAMPDFAGKGQRVDKHACRVSRAHVAAAIADRAQIDLAVATECTDGQESGSQIVAGVGNAQVEAALRDVGTDLLGE